MSQYPAASNIFIEREIAGLRATGVEVVTVTLRAPDEQLLLSARMRAEAATVERVRADKSMLLRDVLRLLLRHPGALAAALSLAGRSGQRRLRNRVWQLFYLVQAVRVHRIMVGLGLRHLHVHFANNSADVARLVVALGRGCDGADAGWRWSLTMHGPTEFEAVEHFDLPAKIESAARVACISDFTRSQLMRLVEPAHWSKLDVVRMSVDLDRYPFVERHRDPGAPLRVLYVGRLVPEKGATVLVDSLVRLHRDGVPFEARVVGAGPVAEVAAQGVATAGLGDRVALLGAVGQDDLPDHYAWADVFCLPSFQEGLPVVLMEAMATGLPVVTTYVAGIPELVVDGVNGRLVPAGRSDLVAASLASLAASPNGRAELGQAARAAVDPAFATTTTTHQQIDFLRRTTAGTAAGH